jgi:oxygen-independent coproporphyrinogen-3 oxidase
MTPFGIYIHFPFCLKKCAYCDFYSCPMDKLSRDIFERYLEALKEDFLQWTLTPPTAKGGTPSPKWGRGRGWGPGDTTLYLGGGTPSLFPTPLLENLFEFIYTCIPQQSTREITIEVNPATIDRDKLDTYKKLGINRISLGVQSLVDTELRTLGRVHAAAQVLTTYELIRSSGFDNVSIDLMFRIPGQTLDTLRYSLETALKLKPEHFSVYSLTLEKDTLLAGQIARQELVLPDEDIDYQMYKMVREILSKNDYFQYEISNFAQKDKECRHNLNYWANGEYIGLGPSAHSQVGGTRWFNPDDLDDYINNSGKTRIKSGKITISEAVFLGLRGVGGINLDHFMSRYGFDLREKFPSQIKKLKENGLLSENNGYLQLTEKGIFLANQVFLEFV